MLRRLASIVVASIGVVAAGAATADCISECLAGMDCSLNYSGSCASALSDCSIRCTGQTPQGPAFGAIAYGRTSGAFGYSFQFATAAAAQESALQHCRENGDDCELAVAFSDSCAALAAGADGDAAIIATHIAGSRAEAESGALATCTADGGAGCEIQVWTCSLP